MSEDNIRKVVEETENSFKKVAQQEQEKKIKAVVQELLEKIEEVKEEIKELSEKKKALETDLEFLKKGRLDLIKEHNDKCNVPYKPITVIPIYVERIREVTPVQPWYSPWTINCGGTSFNTNGSVVKNTIMGTYSVTTPNGTKSISIF